MSNYLGSVSKRYAAAPFSRLCLLGLTVFLLSYAQAQGGATSYIGVGLDAFLLSEEVVPLASLHAASALSPYLELRGTFTTLFPISALAAEVLYSRRFADPRLRLYLGAGPDLVFSPSTASGDTFVVLPAVHATAGLEYRASRLTGLFAEGQAFALYEATVVSGFRLRSGLNFHF